MVNFRMLAIAGALALLIPVGVLADPPQPSDEVEAAADLVADVTDIQLLKPKSAPTPGSWKLHGEQLVEGHTTFVTLDVVTQADKLEGNLTIEGFLNCQHYGEAYYTWWLGLPLPTRVENVHAECHVGERLVVTPSIYCTLNNNPGCAMALPPPSAASMRPTGRLLPFDTPAGDHAFAEELVFTMVVGGEERDYSAWATPVLKSWEGENGLPKNFMLPIPRSAFSANGENHYSVVYESQVNHSW